MTSEGGARARRAIPLGIVLVAAGIALAFWRSRDDAGDALVFAGAIETREIQAGSRVGGRVTEVLVQEGQMVQPGAVLVRFEAAELNAQRLQIEARIAQAEADAAKLERGFRPEEIQQAEAAARREQAALAELRAGPRPQEIQQAQADYDAARAEAANAEVAARRLEQLHGTGDVAAQSVDDARARRDALGKRAEAARKRVELLHAGTRQEELRAAEQRVRQAQANAQLMRSGYRREEIAAARARLEEARAHLRERDTQLAEMQVRAPTEARVEVVSVRPGDLVPAGKPVVTLLELSQLWVRIYVPEPRLAHVRPGQKASVEVESFPKRQFSGTIEQIAAQAEFLPRNVQTREDREHQVFGVKVRVDNSSGLLKPGMAATVRLES
ncbi:MAG: HlyD family efflux transporter periplasmic adaptor subunit [Acidobacteria bacterium]|nr:HlyD family efflux transporter periplasmic adaptor subunit [Acidobacteriota bacterium]MBI3280964.1 HlyD family efflux transporter periplasmic adaptor subunit [Acidobacteriota bacterium]